MLSEAEGGVVDANLKVYGTCTYPSSQTSLLIPLLIYRSKRSSH